MSFEYTKILIADELRRRAGSCSPLELLDYAKALMGDEFEQFKFIMIFKTAFPHVSLKTCINISAAKRFYPDGLGDDQVLEELAPWLPLHGPEEVAQH